MLYMIICFLPALFISAIASLLMRYWSSKYAGHPNSKNLTGHDVVQKVAPAYNLSIGFGVTDQHLGDHYDPSNHNLVLSRDVAQKPSIASVAIAAHELGHAVQHQKGSLLMSIRRLIVPLVNIGSNLGYILIVVGLVLSFLELSWIGVFLFSFTTIFSFLTLPVELDASNKAMGMIKKLDLLDPAEYSGAWKVLTGAALTYVAGLVTSIGNLLYFIMLVRGGSRRD